MLPYATVIVNRENYKLIRQHVIIQTYSVLRRYDRMAEPNLMIPDIPIPDGYTQRLSVLIPPGEARVVDVFKGELVAVIDVRGQQVSDLMAWVMKDPGEYFSPAHTVSCLGRIQLKQGDKLCSNLRRDLFEIIRDTVGHHDLVVPCCDPQRYKRDFGLDDHPSCLQSIISALDSAGKTLDAHGELTWNIFMNNELLPDGSIVTKEPTHKAGDHILLRALDDLTIAATSCPQDLTPCNAWNITEIGIKVFKPL